MAFCDMPVYDLLVGYRNLDFSPVEVIEDFLMRIDRLDLLYNAFSEVAFEGAMQAAALSAQRWRAGVPLSPFDGLPASLKDQWPLQGFATRSGSVTTDARKISSEDAPAAQRLREGGAVFLGKTNLCEFSWNGVTRSALKGESLNPWDPRMNCGGSSGGAAIAAAARLSILNIGSDGAGSIRIPAAFCGVFGFKPTYGLVPAYPQGQLINCSHTGPITSTVFEAALMLDAITRYDPREWLATGDPAPRYVREMNAGIRGLRIGYSRSLAGACAEAAIVEVIDDAVQIFIEQGATVVEVEDHFPNPRPAFEVIYESSLAAGLENFSEVQRTYLDPGLVRNAKRGFTHTAQSLIRALAAREELGRAMNMFHEEFDLLITPQLAVTAFECGNDVPPGSEMKEWLDWSPFTYMFNLTQQPAASVPCGFVNGLPVALQIVGPRHADLRVLQAARAFEQLRPFAMPVLAGAASS